MGRIHRSVSALFLLFLCLTVLFASLFAFFLWRTLRSDSRDRAQVPLILQEEKDVFWYDGAGAPLLSEGAHDLKALWQGKGDASLTLFLCGRQVEQVNLSPGTTAILSVFAPEEAALSLVITASKESDTVFLSDPADLPSALTLLPEGGDVVCTRMIAMQSVSFTVPVRLFGAFQFDSFNLDTALPGRVVLDAKEPFTADLTVFAPACDLYLYGVQPACSEEARSYYLRVPRLNGKPLFEGAIPVFDERDLLHLFDQAVLPRLCDGDTVLVKKAISLSESLSFNGLLSFDFQAPLTGGGKALTLSSSGAGEIHVAVADGVILSSDVFVFDAPKASLVWEGSGAVPGLMAVERLYNVSSFNGEKTRLGGSGEAVPSLTLSLEEGGGAEREEIPFAAVGNMLVATVPYQTTASQLEGASFSLCAEGGEAELEGGAPVPGAVVQTTDRSGFTRRYALLYRREAKNIPAVYLETENGAAIDSRTRYVSGIMTMDAAQSEYESLPLTQMRIRGRGNSTWKWEKKPYKLHFDSPVSLFGLPAAEEWALLANYADKSLMRNHLALVMASTLSFEYTPTQVLVDVFLNGEYQGVYSLGEHLEEGQGRVEVSHNMQKADCGFFLEAGGVVSGVDVRGMNYFHAGLVKFVLIKSPEYNSLTSLQFRYIRNYLLKANDAVKAGAGWEEYLDLDTLVDWMIMTELSNNTDCAWRRSTYLMKNPGEKVKMVTVWDFDLAFGNFSKDVQDYSTWASTNEEDNYVGTTWSTYLLKDPAFQAAFKARWQAVRDDLLKLAFQEIDKTYEAVLPSAEENFIKWHILGRKVAFERKDTDCYPTYDSQIDYLKHFLTRRAAWIDEAVAAWDAD